MGQNARMGSLQDVLDTLTPEADAHVIDAPAAWAQGRTLYGGMSAALAYEAARLALGPLGQLRAAQFTFVGPATGRLRFTSTLLRRGRSSAIVASECFNQEGPAARATFVFGGARESRVTHNFLPAPDVAPPEQAGAFRKGGGHTPPGFWDNFETRFAAGGRLLEVSAPRPEFALWARFLDPGGADPIAALLAIADCPPPAAMVHFPASAPISTMTWSVDLLNQPQDAGGWRLLESSSEHAADGYSMQRMMMWDETGAPLAIGRQTVAIFV